MARNNLATWNSSWGDSSSIEADLKKEKEKRRRRRGKEDPDQKKKKKTTWRRTGFEEEDL